ncbi:hypothetical protein RhiirA5_437741 [Rhizophagus irregularis]|uniref:Uncharacterized protein n=2 Tax=Rhizophagus irregularis TaxID=588596 RepID=U9TB05_RHIID|nr:hypothetical protein GLOIN_2v1885278 [Rhizophagus irregularis DAOM 181602=DAOM 197198]PKB94930.1 hypothetical protein RhiirA5_437741 [Rhizophagus irregularis]PKC62732.1 hypothetical protein RhiirA1_464736 [Rhizophagus irregularis]POG59134.1 hypothetical protein GLOIN_2v1885278 [Rhizophagus irregularis DAOM 181602=DAOM 197198]CAB4484195.1 unnamed protein product [Rhizophagus irregularis]CAB5202967.1 unnamed protein product [Rhizophagus irregularis]|eukprot:XP_025166000.1 hypothetical protein GLOIN_2v1885278 [Rhizophagus irregularis DAOM 181602=DAOM 197198]
MTFNVAFIWQIYFVDIAYNSTNWYICNINILKEFSLSRKLFFFDNPKSIEEYKQNRFEQLNSNNDNNSHKGIDESINIYEN